MKDRAPVAEPRSIPQSLRWPVTSLGILMLLCPFRILADAKAVAKKVLPSVVSIEAYDSREREGTLGSGFFVRGNIVVTNYHVIRKATAAFVKIAGARQSHKVIGVVGLDRDHDLALLLLESSIGMPLRIADIGDVEIGESVYVFGNPEGLEGSISTGLVSSKGTRLMGSQNLIQITAPISPGSSGGPVVDAEGSIIGIASSSLSSGQNLNFAVPAPYLSLLLANMQPPVALSSLDDEGPPAGSKSTREEPSEALPEWIEEVTTRSATTYLNTHRVVKLPNGVVRAWSKVLFNLDTDEGREFQKINTMHARARMRSSSVAVKYVVRTLEVSCAESSFRTVETLHYDPSDRLIFSEPSSDQSWDSPPPGAAFIKVMDTACALAERR